jgi:hypothetical protein
LNTELLGDLANGYGGVRQHSSGAFDLGRSYDGLSPASPPHGFSLDQPSVGTLKTQLAFELSHCCKDMEDQATTRSVGVNSLSQHLQPYVAPLQSAVVSTSCLTERAKRSSFHTIKVSPAQR